MNCHGFGCAKTKSRPLFIALCLGIAFLAGLPLSCTPVLYPQGSYIEVYSFGGQGHKLTWRLRCPNEAETDGSEYLLAVEDGQGGDVLRSGRFAFSRAGDIEVRTEVDEGLPEGLYEVKVECLSGVRKDSTTYLGVLVVKSSGRYITFIPSDERSCAQPPWIRDMDEADKARQRDAGNALQKRVDEAIAEGRSSMTLSTGYYRMMGKGGDLAHLVVKNGQDLVIDGGGSTIFFEDPMKRGIWFENCRNVTLKNVTLDYDPVPWVQARVVEVDEQGRTVTLAIEPGFEQTFEVFKGKKGTYTYHAFESCEKRGRLISEAWVAGNNAGKGFEEVGPGLFRTGFHSRFTVSNAENPISKSGMHVGNAIVMVSRAGKDMLSFRGCSDMTVRDVNIYASPHFASHHLMSDGRNTFKNVAVMRRPNTRRLISCSADGFHFKWLRKGPHIIDCTMDGTMDDAISMAGIFPLVVRAIDRDELIIATRSRGIPLVLKPGNTINTYDYKTLAFQGRAKVVSMDKVAGDTLIGELNKQAAQIKTDLGLVFYRPSVFYRITLDKAIDATSSNIVMSPEGCSADGFTFKGNFIYNNWANSIRVTGHNGTIEGNVFETSGAVRIAPSLSWLNGIFPENILFANNRIIDSKSAIPVLIYGGSWYSKEVASGRCLSNITIKGNTIVNADYAGIAVGNINGLRIENNTLVGTNTENWVPDSDRTKQSGVDFNYGISIHECSDVQMKNNTTKNAGTYMKALSNKSNE